MPFEDDASEQLIRRLQEADMEALPQLLELHRDQLRRAVAVRLDPRLQGRVDPSDVIQETMMEATRRLTEYLKNPKIPFYPWLRAMAMNRLTDLYRHHLLAQKRSVQREVAAENRPSDFQMSDASIMQLADRFVDAGPTPSRIASDEERHKRVRQALEQLEPAQREVLIMTYLEDMSTSEISQIQGVTDRSVRRRHRQALEHLGKLFD